MRCDAVIHNMNWQSLGYRLWKVAYGSIMHHSNWRGREWRGGWWKWGQKWAGIIKYQKGNNIGVREHTRNTNRGIIIEEQCSCNFSRNTQLENGFCKSKKGFCILFILGKRWESILHYPIIVAKRTSKNNITLTENNKERLMLLVGVTLICQTFNDIGSQIWWSITAKCMKQESFHSFLDKYLLINDTENSSCAFH